MYPKEHENWIHIGLNFTVLISLVTGIVIFFQVIRNNSVNHDNLAYIPFIFLFALMNSFTEQMITRFGVVVALDEILPKKGICAISAFIFLLWHSRRHSWRIIGRIFRLAAFKIYYRD